MISGKSSGFFPKKFCKSTEKKLKGGSVLKAGGGGEGEGEGESEGKG